MHRLRNWLEIRKTFFRDGVPEHLDPPRGMLLIGVQGCARARAKAAAAIFGVALLRLDFGVLYSKYYGETEKNLRLALETGRSHGALRSLVDESKKAWRSVMMMTDSHDAF